MPRFARSAALVVFMLMSTAAPAVGIPEFTPNVVDPNAHLDGAAEQRINRELERIRRESNVWGAVFILDTLDGQPIEVLAEQAFQKWGLGSRGADNGLLLVLAMRDRKSRFEVGYGLEGRITDLHARRALDEHLAPKMRTGDTVGAVVDAFAFLSSVAAASATPASTPEATVVGAASESVRDASEGGTALREVGASTLSAPEPQAAATGAPQVAHPLLRAALAIIVFLDFAAACWWATSLRDRWAKRRVASLARIDPTLLNQSETIETAAAPKSHRFDERHLKLFVLVFLSGNPAILSYLIMAEAPAAFYFFLPVPWLLLVWFIFGTTRQYTSVERYRRLLDAVSAQRSELIKKGYLEQTSAGAYSYTAAYHARPIARSTSSSRSSSGSTRRSSSGGGRSGGGGASSGW